jgi:hypothetical protein
MGLKIARPLPNTPVAHSTPAPALDEHYLIPNQSVLAPARISPTLPQPYNQLSGPTETDLGKLTVDAAIEAGVKYSIYSSFADSMALANDTVYCRIQCIKQNPSNTQDLRDPRSMQGGSLEGP